MGKLTHGDLKKLQYRIDAEEKIISVPHGTTKEEVLEWFPLNDLYLNQGYLIQYRLDL